MNELNLLKLTMGICLLAASWLAFSIWRDKWRGLREEERTHFLMFNWAGGAWLFAVFALCGGFYFLLEPILS